MTIERFQPYFLFSLKAIAFLIPLSLLIIFSGALFPYITGKALYFRVLVELGVICATGLLMARSDLRPSLPGKNIITYVRQKPAEAVFWAAILVVVSMFVLLPFSLRPELSFWGNAERMEGVWGVGHFFLWFLVLWVLLRADPKSSDIIFWSFAIVATLIGLQEFQDGILKGQSRPYATLGNPTYVGIYSLIVICLSVYTWLTSQRDRFLQVILALIILICLASLFISGSRGSILGLLVSILTFSLYLLYTSRRTLAVKAAYTTLIIVLLIGAFGFLRTPQAQQIPGINRLASSLTYAGSYLPRWISWGIFWEGFKARPLVGVGLENSPLVYYQFFNPLMFRYEEVIFDRPHNKFLELLVTQGVIGLAAWLIFIILAIRVILRMPDRKQRAALLALVIGYLANLGTLFDMQASYLAFFFAVAIACSQQPRSNNLGNDKKTAVITGQKYKTKELVGAGLIFILIIIALGFNTAHLMTVRQVIGSLYQAPHLAFKAYDGLTASGGPFLTEEAIMLRNYVDARGGNFENVEQAETLQRVLKRAYDKDTHDLRLAQLYTVHLSTIINMKDGQKINSQIERAEAEKVFKQLLSEYPRFPDIYLNYASFLAITGQRQKAVEVLQQGQDLFLYSGRLTHLLAGILAMVGDYQSAAGVLDKAKKEGLTVNSTQMRLLALRVYLSAGRSSQAQETITEILKYDSSTSTRQQIQQAVQSMSGTR